jgi:predicted Fe-Mo cluster-binding NifX family protein
MTHFGAANVNEAVGMFRVLCSELGEKAVEQLKGAGMKMWQFNALLKAWQKHAGVEPGESAGSTAS